MIDEESADTEAGGYLIPFGMQHHRYSTNDLCDDSTNDEVDDITSRLHKLHERRCHMLRRWSVGDDTGGHVGEPPPPVEGRSPPDGHCPGADKITWCPRDDPQPKTDQNPTQRMNESLTKLRRELASLFNQDTAIFENLLQLRQSITQLKLQSYDDLYEDAEVTYLSSNGGSFRFRHDGSIRKGSTETYACFTPLEQQNCEDSGISLVSSGLSSPSMSPSPTATTVAPSATSSPDPAYPTTFPPSRNRHELAKTKRSSVSTPSVDAIGNCILSEFTRPLMTTTSRNRKSFAEAPPALLVRSRSITFLPRGVLVRREISNQPVDGEVFV